MLSKVLLFALSAGLASAHIAAWHKGMYCLNGISGTDHPNTSEAVTPLFQLSFRDWWFHHVNRCDEFPPAPGDVLELPAGGSFTVEMAGNRGQTTLSFGGALTSDWPDGGQHPDDWNVPTCIQTPNLHTQNETMAAGSAFAISYVSELSQVTEENLVVFTVRAHTPWKRFATFDVPADMPACPPDGCICAWGWVPNGCGEPNSCMEGFKCKVTGATSTRQVAPGRPPVWCEDNQANCVGGAKRMVYWNQLEGNNVQVSGNDLSGNPRSPGYNNKMGFSDGAQNDIFA